LPVFVVKAAASRHDRLPDLSFADPVNTIFSVPIGSVVKLS
jgi:hypothetical protein